MSEGEIRRKLADRRGRPRFEIVGELWGSLEMGVGLTLANVSHSGGMVLSPVRLETGSEHHVSINCQGYQSPTKVRVRHVRPSAGDSGQPGYFIGLEFLTVGAVLQTQIQQWLNAAGEPAGS
jgi:hypothetical protein